MRPGATSSNAQTGWCGQLVRLVKAGLQGFRRFADAEINLDAPVVALVGPNESGKTSLLKALAHLGARSTLDDRDTTYGMAPEATRLTGTFLLDRQDAARLAESEPHLAKLRWVTLARGDTGQPAFTTNLALPQDDDPTLDALLPPILEFTDSDRHLRTEYNLQLDHQEWNAAIENLAALAGFELRSLADAATGGRHEIREGILADANKALAAKFAGSWSQADLEVRLNIIKTTQLQVYVATDGGRTLRLADRSDGLRAFVALVAFLAKMEPKRKPVLIVDEAENHLHWDAQADLINLFHSLDEVSQIIYSTHSPGCLPHDLGHGVRAIIRDRENPDRSMIQNWIWESEAGYRPLLLRMGASTAALTPHRQAVITEGVSDFVLLPSLLRDAADKAALEYQVVPGIAQLSSGEVRTVDAETDTVLYLTDGDEGGKDICRVLTKAGVPQTRLFSLPEGTTIEDLVASQTFAAAVNEEFRRSGIDATFDEALPDVGRYAILEAWCQDHSIGVPMKRAIASRVLELTTDADPRGDLPLLNATHRPALRQLESNLLAAFETAATTV